ncbi:hypothetical protein EV177_010492, partial [Coemansia sp. RSA 1804]
MAPPSLPEQQDSMPMHVDEEDVDDYSSGSQDETLLDMAGNEDKPHHPAVGGAAAIEQSKGDAEQEQGPNQGQEPGSNTNEAGQQKPAYLPLDISSMISTVPPVYNPGKPELQPPGLLPAAKATASGNKVNVASEKAWFMKRIKADPAHYDEEAI